MTTSANKKEENPIKTTGCSGHVEPVVMLQALTLDDVKGWDFIGKTPAGRKHYYNKELDTAAYISSYDRKIQFYFNRRVESGNYAACFSGNHIVELAS